MYNLDKERERKGIVKYPCGYCKNMIYRRYNKSFCSTECKFLGNIVKTETCWNWIGEKNMHGYGEIGINSKAVLAHRYAFESYISPIKNGMYVLHSCDNRSCVNPGHLRLGTAADNLRDASLKGRLIKGSSVAVSKLKEADIPEIRQLYKDGLTQEKISKKFGVTQSMIGRIVRKVWWRHV